MFRAKGTPKPSLRIPAFTAGRCPAKGLSAPDPGHKGVPPLWNPDQRTASLGTGKPRAVPSLAPLLNRAPVGIAPASRPRAGLAAMGLFRLNQPRQPIRLASHLSPILHALKPRFPPVCPTGGLLGCDQTRRETRVEMSDCATVALRRRDGRQLAKHPLIRNRLIFVFCHLR